MKRLNLAIAIAATIVLSSAAFADEEADQPREGNIRERLMKEFDADGDGKLNDEEQAKARAAMAKLRGTAEGAGRPDKAQLMKKFDKDGDGKLNEEERQAAMKAGGEFMKQRGGDFPNKEALVKKFDKDGDGQLNEEERQAAMKAAGQFMKQNGGTPPGQGFPNKEALVKKFDKDGDGKLDDGEQAAAREAIAKLREQGGAGALPGGGGETRKPRVDKKELLEKFDADGDGELNDEERAKARDEFQKKSKQGKE